MSTHDRVLAYGDTYKSNSKPLILVIGREPSADTETITDTLGNYDFQNVRSSSFWNVAYRYLAYAGGSNEKAFKEQCRINNKSPLVIGDALPIGVKNGNASVSRSRGAVSKSDIDAHVESTLAISKTAERVKLIVLAGHLAGKLGGKSAIENLKYASSAYREQAANICSDKIPVIDIPFLTDQNATNLRKVLKEGETPNIVNNIFTKFFE